MARCRKCRGHLNPDTVVCHLCGTPLAGEIPAERAPTVIGAPRTAETPPATPAPAPSPARQARKAKLVGALAFWVAVALIAAGGPKAVWTLVSQKTPEPTPPAEQVAPEVDRAAEAERRALEAQAAQEAAAEALLRARAKAAEQAEARQDAPGDDDDDSDAALPDDASSREMVSRVIRSRLPAVRACYERQVRVSPSLDGRVVVGWTIDPRGRVRDAEVIDDTTGSDALGQCILRGLRGWVFPRRGGAEIKVTYPFVFKQG